MEWLRGLGDYLGLTDSGNKRSLTRQRSRTSTSNKDQEISENALEKGKNDPEEQHRREMQAKTMQRELDFKMFVLNQFSPKYKLELLNTVENLLMDMIADRFPITLDAVQSEFVADPHKLILPFLKEIPFLHPLYNVQSDIKVTYDTKRLHEGKEEFIPFSSFLLDGGAGSTTAEYYVHDLFIQELKTNIDFPLQICFCNGESSTSVFDWSTWSMIPNANRSPPELSATVLAGKDEMVDSGLRFQGDSASNCLIAGLPYGFQSIPIIRSPLWEYYVADKPPEFYDLQFSFSSTPSKTAVNNNNVDSKKKNICYVTKTLETSILLMAVKDQINPIRDSDFFMALEEAQKTQAVTVYKMEEQYGKRLKLILLHNLKRVKKTDLGIKIRAFDHEKRQEEWSGMTTGRSNLSYRIEMKCDLITRKTTTAEEGITKEIQDLQARLGKGVVTTPTTVTV